MRIICSRIQARLRLPSHHYLYNLGMCFYVSVDYYSFCDQTVKHRNLCSMLQKSRLTTSVRVTRFKLIKEKLHLAFFPCHIRVHPVQELYLLFVWLFDWLLLSSLWFYGFQIDEFEWNQMPRTWVCFSLIKVHRSLHTQFLQIQNQNSSE